MEIAFSSSLVDTIMGLMRSRISTPYGVSKVLLLPMCMLGRLPPTSPLTLKGYIGALQVLQRLSAVLARARGIKASEVAIPPGTTILLSDGQNGVPESHPNGTYGPPTP